MKLGQLWDFGNHLDIYFCIAVRFPPDDSERLLKEG
jgi:hypothetical protein